MNEVLTASYRAVYGGDDRDELILVTAPLTATSEVLGLYAGGVIDYETAMPAALHSLGCSSEEISSALDRRRELEKNDAVLKQQREKTELEELKSRSAAASKTSDADSADSSSSRPAAPQSENGGDD